MPTKVIDAWMQHPEGSFWGHRMFASLRRWAGAADGPIPDIPIEMTLGAMDAAGVEVGVLSAWWGPEGEHVLNESVAQLVEQYPGRFVGIASVDLSRPMEAVRSLRYWVRERKLRGLRLLPWLWNLPPDDRRFYPLYVECIELGIPFCLQVGHTGPMCPSEPGRPIPYLDRVALDFPELTIVGGHIGYPWTNEMITLARKYPNVYIDTSAYKTSRYPRELVDYMRADGKKKVLFGSNYPMIMPGDALADLDSLDLPEDAKLRFLTDNARRVFRIDI